MYKKKILKKKKNKKILCRERKNKKNFRDWATHPHPTLIWGSPASKCCKIA